MASGADLFQAGEPPKRGGGGRRGVVLSPYQNLLLYYEKLQNAYGWTAEEVDGHEIAFLLDQLVVLDLVQEKPGKKYIDDVM
ncbi:MAG: hypothetical protein IKH16_04845 [Selenomonadaceae bacterium]|nr:hypothetical protein [Selenomonadaceae bacterium]